jgi:hypothetical protein
MSKIPVISVLIVCKITEDQATNKIKTLHEYLPTGTCLCNTFTLYTTEIQDVVAFIEANPEKLDLIIQYGLGNDLLWESDKFKGIPTVSNNNSYDELFGADHIMSGELFPKIKKVYTGIDDYKSLPEGLHIAKTKEDLKYITDKCLAEAFGADTETNFLNPFLEDPKPEMVCFSVAWLSNEDEGWCIPTNQKLIDSGECEYTVEEAIRAAEIVFFETEQDQYWQNFHYDALVLWELFGGRKPKNFAACTMLLLNLYHKAMKPSSLDKNVQMVGLPAYKNAAKDWIAEQPKRKKGQDPYTFADVPLEIIGPYAALDALAVVRIVNFLKKNLPNKQWAFYYTVMHPVLLSSLDLCIQGYEISRDRYMYSKLSVEEQILEVFKQTIDVVKPEIPERFNINSSKQLATLMYDKLNLPVLAKTDGGDPATGSKVLDDLILFHPFIFYLSKFKKLMKLYTSYVLGYENVLGPGSRHVKTNSRFIFNAQLKQINRTARLSSTNMFGYKKTTKKGGSILTLPGTGSMVKHYFAPREVVAVENELYSEILEALKQSNEEEYTKVIAAFELDITKTVKPPKEVKEKKPRVTKKKQLLAAQLQAAQLSNPTLLSELEEEDESNDSVDSDLPWNE